ncbi:phage tail domain-containing protein [Streptomyces sp. H27-C3]|uniref:phage distal tail protein n=1 Tax=Streptomyces sp. H27-C3 TaxID=3046305 RepID=UPI0024BB56A8|nr:phage tail domain-containing protein [Streptomyces sp. H27-C3]MDJ0464979.1 phage tail family protein [Streptomyces sp. H27-C3]
MNAILNDYQHELGGVVIGTNTPVSIAAIEGLGRADVRTGDVEPPSTDGIWLGADYYTGRTVRIDAAIKTPGDPARALDILAALQRVHDEAKLRQTGGATTELRMKFPGRDVRVLLGRLRKAEADLSTLVHGWLPLDIEFLAADHLYYGEGLQRITIPLGMISGGGFTAPVVAPIVVNPAPGAAVRPGWIDVGGKAPTWPVLRITGPCANPSITHVESGRSLQMTATIAAGDWIEIDTRPTWRSVLRNNGGNVPLTGTSRLDTFSLPTGRSELRWTATDPTNTARLAVSWRPAWPTL